MRNVETRHTPYVLQVNPELLKTVVLVTLRVVFGFAWLMAGVTKESEKGWFSDPNTFLTAYLSAARENPDVNGYYRWFIESVALQHVSVLNYSIPIAQIIAGTFIMLGLVTLPMLLVVLFMHVNFLLSGSINEISLVLYTSLLVLLFGLRYARRVSLDGWLACLRAPAAPDRSTSPGRVHT